MTHLALTALVNSMAITGLVTVIVCLILRASRNSWNAATREAVWWAVLLVSVITPVLFAGDVWLRHSDVVPLGPQPRSDSVRIGVSEPVQPSRAQSMAVGRETLAWKEGPKPVEAMRLGRLFPVQIPAERWPSWIMGAWLVTSLISLSRLAAGYILLHRRKSRAQEAPDQLAMRAQQYMERFGASHRRIRVAISTEITSPVAAGPFRPTILVPVRLFEQLKESELDQISLHEVAHFGPARRLLADAPTPGRSFVCFSPGRALDHAAHRPRTRGCLRRFRGQHERRAAAIRFVPDAFGRDFRRRS